MSRPSLRSADIPVGSNVRVFDSRQNFSALVPAEVAADRNVRAPLTCETEEDGLPHPGCYPIANY